jgi:hypothetical protein
MIDHDFQPVVHWRIGPLRNKWGWTFSAAEIGEIWYLRWIAPDGVRGLSLYPDHDSVVEAIEVINQRADGSDF